MCKIVFVVTVFEGDLDGECLAIAGIYSTRKGAEDRVNKEYADPDKKGLAFRWDCMTVDPE